MRLWRQRKAQIPMMHLASLFCHVGAARVFVWLPVSLGSLPQRQGLAPCDCLFSRPRSLALSFLSNSHWVPPFIFLYPPLRFQPCRLSTPLSIRPFVHPLLTHPSPLSVFESTSASCYPVNFPSPPDSICMSIVVLIQLVFLHLL